MSFVIFLSSIIALTVAYLYFVLKKKFSYFDEKGIPHLKPESWVFGNVKGVGTTIHLIDVLQKIYDHSKVKDVIAGLYIMSNPTLLIIDLDLIKQITVKEFASFTDRSMPVIEDEPLTGHLFAIGGDKWKFMRSKLSHAFTSGKIKLMYHTVSDKGMNLVKAIDDASKDGSVEVKDITNRFTIDVVSSAAFGMESDTLKYEHPEFVAIFRRIFGDEGNSKTSSIVRGVSPRLAKFLGYRVFDQEVDDFFFDVVGRNIKYRESNNVVRNDFLNMLIQLKNKGVVDGEITTDVRKLTYDEVIAQAFIFFFAGGDTSSSAISYTIAELGDNLHIQEKLRQEVLEKTKNTNGEITYDNLNEMTYLNQVVNGNYAVLSDTVDDLHLFFRKHTKISTCFFNVSKMRKRL